MVIASKILQNDWRIHFQTFKLSNLANSCRNNFFESLKVQGGARVITIFKLFHGFCFHKKAQKWLCNASNHKLLVIAD